MIIYENESFAGKYLSEVGTKWFISETCLFNRDSKYESGMNSFKLNSFLKRGDTKRNKIKNKNN